MTEMDAEATTPPPTTPPPHPALGTPSWGARLAAEGFASFLLVFSVVAVALLGSVGQANGMLLDPGTVYLAVALAAGLAFTLAMIVFSGISGAHVTPVVTVALAAAGRFAWREVVPYLAAQLVGALAATTVFALVGLFGPGQWLLSAQDAGFVTNGWGERSPQGFGLGSTLVVELVLSAFVALVALATRGRTTLAFAAAAGGLVMALGMLVTMPIDGGGLNPARSIATAIYGPRIALAQLWIFVIAPLAAAAIAGVAYRPLFLVRHGIATQGALPQATGMPAPGAGDADADASASVTS